jgi:NAD(P)-dependent dehydrogenase (short-subunit alcohol dehydrogenase family)
MQTVEGRVAVVTGAGSGMGRGMARAFADAGMRVVASDIRKDTVDAVVEELRAKGHEAVGVQTDVSQYAEVEALAATALDAFGAVHVLCNNAGVGTFAPISRTSIDDWEWILGIDLWGPIYGVKVFLPIIEREEEGHINSTASVAGLLAGGLAGPYNVAKHGVVALMATLERELRSAKSSVRTSVLCPGAVRTNIASNSVDSRRQRKGVTSPGGTEGQKLAEKMDAALASGMDPDDVGRLVLEGILTDRFWIFTEPRLLRHLHEQVEVMTNDQLLTRLRLF